MENNIRIEFEDSGTGYIGKVIHDESGLVPFFKIQYVQEGASGSAEEIAVEWNQSWKQKMDLPGQTAVAGKSFIDAIGKEIENYYRYK